MGHGSGPPARCSCRLGTCFSIAYSLYIDCLFSRGQGSECKEFWNLEAVRPRGFRRNSCRANIRFDMSSQGRASTMAAAKAPREKRSLICFSIAPCFSNALLLEKQALANIPLECVNWSHVESCFLFSGFGPKLISQEAWNRTDLSLDARSAAHRFACTPPLFLLLYSYIPSLLSTASAIVSSPVH
jgi:hypothetical protein